MQSSYDCSHVATDTLKLDLMTDSDRFCFVYTAETSSRGCLLLVPLVEQEVLTLPEHLSSPPIFSGVHVTRSLVLCVCFVDRCLSFFFWPLC